MFLSSFCDFYLLDSFLNSSLLNSIRNEKERNKAIKFAITFKLGLDARMAQSAGLKRQSNFFRQLETVPANESCLNPQFNLSSPSFLPGSLSRSFTAMSSMVSDSPSLLNIERSLSPSIPSQFSALWMEIRSAISFSSVFPILPPRPFSGPNTKWLYRGSFITGKPRKPYSVKKLHGKNICIFCKTHRDTGGGPGSDASSRWMGGRVPRWCCRWSSCAQTPSYEASTGYSIIQVTGYRTLPALLAVAGDFAHPDLVAHNLHWLAAFRLTPEGKYEWE